MFIHKENASEFAEKLLHDVTIRDSMDNNKVHLDECSMKLVYIIAEELRKGISDTSKISINFDVYGNGQIWLYDGDDEYFCRSLMTWGPVK